MAYTPPSRFNIFPNVLFFLIGLSTGIISTLYLQSFEISFKGTILPSWLSTPLHPYPPLPPSPLLPPSPPPPPPLSLPPPPPLSPLVFSPPRVTNGTMDSSLIDDTMLLLRASNVSKKNSSYVPKIAFLFLAKGPLPLAPLWEKFFKGYEDQYSIYIHTHPSFIDTKLQGSIFQNKRIPSKAVTWGTLSMIDAERRLLANALLDFSNQRFVLLSESCIPLFNFTIVYNNLINSKTSFLSSYTSPAKDVIGRYNNQMFPPISKSDWRKGSQWFELHRDLAIEVVSDTKYYSIFHKHCVPPCYSDEHYIPTLVNMVSPELNSNRSITWVDWSKGGAHLGKFSGVDISMELIERMRGDTNCMYNRNKTSICFLFARKFLPNTLSQLLNISSSILGFDS